MAKRGYRKYRCADCTEESWHHWIERNRAARMRCPRCGCTRLDLCSPEARSEQADLNAVRVAGHRSMTHPAPDSPRRKVT